MRERVTLPELLESSWPPFITDAGAPTPGREGDQPAFDDDEQARRSANAALMRVLARSARRGEYLMSVARFGITLVALVMWLAFTHERLLAGDLWVYGMCAYSMAVSVLIVFVLRRRIMSRALLVVSVVVDASIPGGLAWGLFAFDEPPFVGVPKLLGVWVTLLTLVGCGFRLSRRVALIGALAHFAWIIPLAVTDLARPGLPPHAGRDWAIFFTLSFGAAVVGVFVAARTRALSVDVATRALLGERARALLGAYVSEEVAEHALQQSSLKLGGERVQAAVLFSDLRGFTSYAERLSPEELVAQLNAYLDIVVEAIRAEGGVVDKYIGDGIMAVFGVPSPTLSDARHAVRAAVSMQGALVRHNRERAARGLPPLAQGIGVHYGPVVAGNVGTAERASYTVIGDTVNVSSRLESSTKDQSVAILISEDAARAAGAGVDVECPELVEVGVISVKGRTEPLRVFTVKLG